MKNYSKEIFLEKLREIQFRNLRNFENINVAYQTFLDKITLIIDKLAPLKEIRVKGSSKPWFEEKIQQNYTSKRL